MRRKTFWATTMLALVVVTGVGASLFLVPSNIDPAHKVSWSENAGWMNWLDANGGADGVFVGTDFLSGYIWMENTGWLNVGDGGGPYANTNDTNFGVNILPGGDLEGFAWGENVGWINFEGGALANPPNPARFDFTPRWFLGYAWGENVGWINLDDATHYAAVIPLRGNIVWNADPLSADRTTRSLRFRVEGKPNGSVEDAIKVELVELMHPNPRNVDGGGVYLPGDFSKFDTSMNGVCADPPQTCDAGHCSLTNASCTLNSDCHLLTPNYNGYPCKLYPSLCECIADVAPPVGGPFQPDANDVVTVVNCVNAGICHCTPSCDINCDGRVNVADVDATVCRVRLLLSPSACCTNADCLDGNAADSGTCSNLTACTAAGEANPPSANGVGGCARWVGPPITALESQDNAALGDFRGARLQCTPYYRDWTPEGLITVVGAEIAPSSEYSVRTYGASCMGAETDCTNVSPAVTMYTRRAGDVAAPYNPPSSNTQPDGIDVSQIVAKFKSLPGAPKKAEVQVQPNLPGLNSDIDAIDIVIVVDNFKGYAYSFSGPCVCPSTVTCNLTPCANPTPCGDGTCVKTCIDGTYAGLPCINNSHCPGGSCGAGFCRDRCGRCTP